MKSIPPSTEQLKRVIQIHPLIDNHAHNLLSCANAINYDRYPFESITSEAGAVALQNAQKTLPHIRAANQLAEFYECSPSWDEIKATRQAFVRNDYEELVRRCLEGTHALLLDDLLMDQDIEPFDWHDRFTVSETKRIVRIETVAAHVLEKTVLWKMNIEALPMSEGLARQGEFVFREFSDKFTKTLESAILDPKVAGFKSVICYRTGLEIRQHSSPYELHKSYLRAARDRRPAGYRVEDKPFNDWIVLQTLEILKTSQSKYRTTKPLQLHTGLGDSDIDLVRSNPAYLQPVIANYPEVNFVLLHSSYPYTREAGYLACVYPNVYLDLGEVFPMVSRGAQECILHQAFEMVPTSRILWSTDGHFFPETYWLANKQFRQALEKVMIQYVIQGDYTVDQAVEAAADILFHNSNRLYSLGLTLNNSSNDTTTTTRASSLSDASGNAVTPDPMVVASDETKLESFIQSNPDVRFIWIQWVDYIATTRARMFPIHEFTKIVRRNRRIGVCMATFNLLQDDRAAGRASSSGQLYLRPDLSSLYRNVGCNSKSATIMTDFVDENGEPFEGCPRLALLNIASKLRLEYGIDVLCGFEIEVVLLRPSMSSNNNNSKNLSRTHKYEPLTTNHSWSQITPEIRNGPMSILEETVETLSELGIQVEQYHAESAPSQFEFVLPPSAPRHAVDTLLKARQVVVDVAYNHGLRATLHPRPYPSAAGTAAHSHISISPATHETSFLAGILSHLPSVLAFTLSQDTSYDRVVSGLWAGGEWIAWGTQNRETPIRKISPGHWEIKTVDGFANMYLCMSALLAAGYLGLLGGLELQSLDCDVDPATLTSAQRSELGITSRLPVNFTESLDALESPHNALQSVLGKSLVETYVAVKREEKGILDGMDEDERKAWLIERY